jgi:hypothetical protein
MSLLLILCVFGIEFPQSPTIALHESLNKIKMKYLIIILTILFLISCEKQFEKEDFLGTWEIVTTTDSQTGVVNTIDDKYRFLVHLKPDSLYKENGVYDWEIIGDSIFVNEWPFYIKEVTDDKVIVETESFYENGRYLIELAKRNRKYEKFDLLGTWEMISETDLETGEVYWHQDDDDEKFLVDIRFDSLSPSEDDVYAWEIKKDSIMVYVNDWPWSFYIRELSGKKLFIENQKWFSDGKMVAEFEKRK